MIYPFPPERIHGTKLAPSVPTIDALEDERLWLTLALSVVNELLEKAKTGPLDAADLVAWRRVVEGSGR